jgi:acyl-CoA thioester hydrolase
MAATQLDPALAASTTHIRIRFCETDLMGIVHHANYLAYFEEGRVDWLRKRGITYAEWAKKGVHLPVVEASTRYRAPLAFDDEVRVETRLSELKSHSLRFDYRATRGPLLIAEATTRLACVGADHKLQRVPAGLVEVLVRGEVDG